MPSFGDRRITESSGLAMSRITPDMFYTINDEGTRPHIFAVQASTGQTVGTASVDASGIKDPEAISVDKWGQLWYCDIGDNNSDRHDCAIYMRGELTGLPANLGNLPFTKYPIAYPDGPRNAECFLTHPSGDMFIISKEASGHLYKLPANLQVGQTNTLTLVSSSLPTDVSDGAFTPDGRFVLIRRKNQNSSVFVLDPAASWAVVFTIGVNTQTKPEGITVALDQLSFWTSSEGQFAPIFNEPMPVAYQPLPPAAAPANPCGG